MEELERISNVTVSQKVKPHQLCLEHITASWNRVSVLTFFISWFDVTN